MNLKPELVEKLREIILDQADYENATSIVHENYELNDKQAVNSALFSINEFLDSAGRMVDIGCFRFRERRNISRYRWVWHDGMWVRVETTALGHDVIYTPDLIKWLAFKETNKKIYGAEFSL